MATQKTASPKTTEKMNKPLRSPVDVAREAFQSLATRKVAPTPEAYRAAYEEIAGAATGTDPGGVLASFAQTLSRLPGEAGRLGQRLVQACDIRDWTEYSIALNALGEQYLAPRAGAQVGALTQLDSGREYINDTRKDAMLRELLARLLSFNIASFLSEAPELSREAKTLATDLRNAFSEAAMTEVAARIKQLSFQIELQCDDIAQQQELLLRLFQLLLENIHALLDKGSWLSGQIANVQDLISGPISQTSVADATRSLKEVIYKQGLLKETINEEKITVKNLMLNFVDQLGSIVNSTSSYHKSIGAYSEKVGSATNIGDLNSVLNGIMRETRTAQYDALKARDEMVYARQEVQKAEARVQSLESQLVQMSELVREDQLTGSLNRRGLDETLTREITAANRRGTPLCIALLDLDDFKRLNDTHGHSAGDEVLIHLVKVIKDTLRKLDVIARFGGEEFLIVLPETPPDEAMATITRVQRELTKRIFMHNQEKLLITFSAGIALMAQGESQGDMIKRADAALYRAKAAGKNRIVMANPPV
jgi:diguanylate cyclase